MQDYIDEGCGDPPGYAKEYANKPIPLPRDQSNFAINPPTQQQVVKGAAEVGVGVIILGILIRVAPFALAL
jgi:hypothetical protein